MAKRTRSASRRKSTPKPVRRKSRTKKTTASPKAKRNRLSSGVVATVKKAAGRIKKAAGRIKKAAGRVKQALRRDRSQTKSDLTDTEGRDLNQGVGDTPKQAAGVEPIPPHSEPS